MVNWTLRGDVSQCRACRVGAITYYPGPPNSPGCLNTDLRPQTPPEDSGPTPPYDGPGSCLGRIHFSLKFQDLVSRDRNSRSMTREDDVNTILIIHLGSFHGYTMLYPHYTKPQSPPFRSREKTETQSNPSNLIGFNSTQLSLKFHWYRPMALPN